MSQPFPLPERFDAVFPLRVDRVHEVCGRGRLVSRRFRRGNLLAMYCGSRRVGSQLNPSGLTPFCDPTCILTADSRDQADALAVAEEALRSGAVSLVVTGICKPLSLTAGRRLQLAAQAGAATGLCLIPEGMGSNAAETRWHSAPVFDGGAGADSTLMRWPLIKNKLATTGIWDVRWVHEARRLYVVSASGE